MSLFGFWYFDPLYLVFMIPGLVVGLVATAMVKARYAKYSRVPSQSSLTGAQAARMILDQAALEDYDTASGGAMSTRRVAIEAVPGQLADHYDPEKRVLRLSPEVYEGRSLAALGIAAHEAGHAIQHATGYRPLGMRTALYPLANLGSQAWMWLILLGLFVGGMKNLGIVLNIGIALFSFAVVFYLITLPVEFNASKRAMACLTQYGMVSHEEARGAQKVLTAAALTYVAAAITAVFQLLYLLTVARDD